MRGSARRIRSTANGPWRSDRSWQSALPLHGSLPDGSAPVLKSSTRSMIFHRFANGFVAIQELEAPSNLFTANQRACSRKKLIFKTARALGYKLHQDIPLTWKGFPKTFLTVLIPIDASSQENGCTEVFSGYHRDFLSTDASNVTCCPDDYGVDAARCTLKLILNPGDIAIFHGLTPHRSDPNRFRARCDACFTSAITRCRMAGINTTSTTTSFVNFCADTGNRFRASRCTSNRYRF